MTETYDINTTYVSAIPAPSKGNDTWVFPVLNANETIWINISVPVNPSAPIGSVLQNIVKLSCAEEVTDSDTEFTTLFARLQNCTCGDICVNTTGWWRDGGAFCARDRPIQDAIDNASAGDTVCVTDGTYTENVDVNKQLTIRSENGAASTTVQALNSDDHVFEVDSDYVNISGFTVTGANGSWNLAGIYLNDSVNQCNISDNAATNNGYGVLLDFSSNNELTGNIANSNNEYGFYLESNWWAPSRNNIIYNNYFNNTDNAYGTGSNIWNITMTLGENIIGGPYLGGNYWSNYTGTDSNHNGFGDTPYNIPPGISKDYLPLVTVEPSPCFIATAAYGTPLHEDIDILRDFRDEYLMSNPTGRAFVNIYYNASPPIADLIRGNEGLGTAVQEGFVKPLVYVTRGFVG